MEKKTILTNDYCHSQNDGFGCSFIKRKDALYCAVCLASVLQDIARDLSLLTDEADEHFLNGDDD